MLSIIIALWMILLSTGNGFRSKLSCIAQIRSSPALYLNRIFFEESECQKTENDHIFVQLNASDDRYLHIKNILKSEVGDILKVGILNRGVIDSARLVDSSSETIRFDLGRSSSIRDNPRPNVDLILAVPRPLRLERLLPVISSLGVGRIVLVGADKVEKDYFGSHLFRRPQALRACLVEGLSQAGVDCNVPEIVVRKNLVKFLQQDVDVLFPPHDYFRIIFHPQTDSPGKRISRLEGRCGVSKAVVAIGPEGGWTDEELIRFENMGFENLHLGNRILRTDTAVRSSQTAIVIVTALQVVSSLALVHEWSSLNMDK